MAMPRSQRTPDPVHDPADQVVEPVNPEEPSGQKDRLAAPSKGKKKTTSVAGTPVADVQNQMDTMFRFFSEQNELMFTKLVERIDNKLSEIQSLSQPPAAKKSKVSEPTQFVVTADVHQTSGNDDVIVDNEDVEDDGNDDVDDNDNNDDMDDQDNSDIVFTHPDESESFLGDPEFLPKSAKQERARNLLFTAAADAGKTDRPKQQPPKVQEVSMLEKFLDSLPAEKKAEVEGTCILGKFFSAAPSFAAVKDSPTFPLDEQQVVLLKKFWRAPNPSKLTAFSEESFKILKVDEEFFDLTKVPTMDDFVKHVNTSKGSTTTEGFRSRIWQNLETDLRKIHRGVRVGLLAQALNQHILSNISQLVQEWSDNEVLSDSQAAAVNQLLLASFDAGNRALEQAARQVGMLHRVRRKVLLEDLQILKRNRDEWLRLPLSSEGIMGEAFVNNLENMRKMSKEYKASAQQLGLLNNRATSQKRTFEQSEQSQFKRPFSHPFRGARGSFCGRGSLSGRGRGGNRGAWNQVGRGRGFQPSATAASTSESNQAWLSTG